MSKKKTTAGDGAAKTATTKRHNTARAAKIARRIATGPHAPMRRKAPTGAAEGRAWFSLVRRARGELA